MRKEDRERLIRLLDYLESEVDEYSTFVDLAWEIYQKDKVRRRNVERWIESIVMSSIDLAKVLLASENRPIPDSYKETLYNIGLLGDFNEDFGKRLSRWAGLRNIVVHEYLDIRWKNIKEFIKESEPVFRELVKGVKKILAQPDPQQKL
jgi:uncharacterized protein YutE (UPF0331/DUF86 family)